MEFDIDEADEEDEDLHLQELKPYLLDLKAKHNLITVGAFPKKQITPSISKATESIVNVISITNQQSNPALAAS